MTPRTQSHDIPTAPRATAVVDLGFGDAGKGTMVDTLAAHHDAELVVRFNGGAQAGHNVVTPDGRHHTFSQLGSATFQPGVHTLLSRHVALHPLALDAELEHLAAVGVPDALSRLHVDRRAIVTTPYHQCTNRLREVLRGPDRHGSVGVGHGESVYDSLEHPEATLHVGMLGDRATVRRRLRRQRALKLAVFDEHTAALSGHPTGAGELELLQDPGFIETIVDAFHALSQQLDILDADGVRALLERQKHIVFEGAQGTLLDEWHGFHPYTTWSTTTFQGAEEVLADAELEIPLERIGVLRTYAVRHGDGPFVTEDPTIHAAIGEPHNETNAWQGRVRTGWFDAVATRYALEVCGGIDALALTHVDALPRLPVWRICTRYASELADSRHDTGASSARHGEGSDAHAPSPSSHADLVRLDPDGDIDELVPPGIDELERQARMTRLLESGVGARYVDVGARGRGADADRVMLGRVLRAMTSTLDVEVGWLSTGPTRRDKVRVTRIDRAARPNQTVATARPQAHRRPRR